MVRTYQVSRISTGGIQNTTMKEWERSNAVSKSRRPGQGVIKEIRKHQQTTKLLLPLLPFQRLVEEIVQSIRPGFGLHDNAVAALQEAAEAYQQERFDDINLCAKHRQGVTITTKDSQLVQRIRGDFL